MYLWQQTDSQHREGKTGVEPCDVSVKQDKDRCFVQIDEPDMPIADAVLIKAAPQPPYLTDDLPGPECAF